MDMTQQSLDRKIGPVILDLNNISLSFGGVKALTDISFDVRQHEIRAIIGPNGAGKSSMLNVINGVYRPRRASQEHGLLQRGEGGHRAHLPEHRAVQGHDGTGQHHDRP
jgi:branched-chain amino acid transport system ATP-binding protein